MATISVRDLDEDVAGRLRVRATRNGRSMESEVRTILTDILIADTQERPNLAQAFRERFADFGGVELDIPPRRDRPRSAVITSVRSLIHYRTVRTLSISVIV